VIRFRIRLPPIIRHQWYELAAKLNNVILNENKDKVAWKWTASGSFSVKLVYEHLIKDENGHACRVNWKVKIHEKIKIFMWLTTQKVILTKDNMLRRNWQGNSRCYLCDASEMMDHLFL
jgi:hypothetical protein